MQTYSILCYGDSNTWGFDPHTKNRYLPSERWTGILTHELGAGFRVIEEGLNGRTTILDDPFEAGRNGLTYLIPCLQSHHPIDLVVLMLGTNDQKIRFSLSPHDIALGITTVIKAIQASGCGPEGRAPKVLLLCPPPIRHLSEYADFFEGAPQKSLRLAEHYRRIAGELACVFLNTADIVSTSEHDGVHLERSEHRKLGSIVAKVVKSLF